MLPETLKNLDLTALSLDERTLLAHTLWHSIRHELETTPLTLAQQAEVERRLTELDSGSVELVPWEQVQKILKSGQWLTG